MVFVVRWKNGVDRGETGRCTSMQVCSCHREKVLSLLHFLIMLQKVHMQNNFFFFFLATPGVIFRGGLINFRCTHDTWPAIFSLTGVFNISSLAVAALIIYSVSLLLLSRL